jgi:hypothetical protein
MVSAAAALAGVLGAAFALVIGVPTDRAATNDDLAKALARLEDPHRTAPIRLREKVITRLRRVLSVEAGGAHRASWPLTFGIWIYAAVASSVAISYLLNPQETPQAVKALAIAFGGYVIPFVTSAYGMTSRNK